MTEENVERASITLKGGTGYDAPWVVLKGGTLDEAAGELAKLNADDATLRAVATVAAAFHRVYLEAKNGVAAPAPTQQAPVTSPTPSEPIPQASQPAPQAPPQDDDGGGFCGKCGTQREWRQWTQKGTNKEFKGWFCPKSTAKGDGHTPVFK